ncbi:SMP-30/gluconolactonase/LRE family protein [Microbulbifer elongatus]|uniref:SMP-30/gluconolactonase/LRE family protein n=1 Tax=Microbulbifer elongatus TaxID=86173 RepID=UPI001CFCA535|nr:SMP-30/gluconolactonase/LRE family protein [Microbulbifer elongatus]
MGNSIIQVNRRQWLLGTLAIGLGVPRASAQHSEHNHMTASTESNPADVSAEVFDDRICALGEGPLWHPQRKTLYWVDLLNNRVLARGKSGVDEWDLGEMPSALAWIDTERMLVACESGLNILSLETGEKTLLCTLEPEIPGNRSNDGRADPWGGFWIGTMGKNGEPGQGNLYRWYRGELRKLDTGLTVPNGLCFDRERRLAYYADSAANTVYKLALDAQTGWPESEREVHLDLAEEQLIPDGAVADAAGNMWTSLWDAARTQCYSPQGEVLGALRAPVIRTTCPAFGGEDFTDMYVTTAAVGLEDATDAPVANGVTLVYRNAVQGQPEPAVILDGAVAG